MNKNKTKEPTRTLIEIADELAAKGELKMTWDGGGDSGSSYIWVDEKQVEWYNNNDLNRLVDALDDVLQYGSWAGEFTARGEAIYDKVNKTFTGEDVSIADEYFSTEANIRIAIPDEFWFDRVEFSLQDDNIMVNIFVRNGVITGKLLEVQSVLESPEGYLYQEITNTIDKAAGNEGLTVNGYWNEGIIPHEEFKKEGNELVYYIKKLNYSAGISEERIIFVDLKKKERVRNEYDY